MESGRNTKENSDLPDPHDRLNFESHYLELREKEQRLYSDEEVALLPEISMEHVHYKEWLLRKKSGKRLIEYLKNKETPLTILEVGCGNGWLSSKLADINNAVVTGIDINRLELKQAASVFRDKTNLHFEYGDIRDENFAGRKFDILIFAASVQYFPSLFQILNKASTFINPGGEIHILDTPFYKDGEVDTARQRSKEYYDSTGFPEMGAYYFHHKLSGLHHFQFKFMYDPHSFMNRLMNKNDPFYWLCILPKL